MRVKNLILGVGIFIVFLLVLNYGIEAFYPSPQYDSYCRSQAPAYAEAYPVKGIVGMGGVNCTYFATPQQQNECNENGGFLVSDRYDSDGCPSSYKCDFCAKQFNDAQKEHSKTVFVISLIAGIVTLLAGYLILSTEPVGSALMASGVGALVYGSIRNWQNLSNIWRFVLLLAALVLLIWIALHLNRQRSSRSIRKK